MIELAILGTPRLVDADGNSIRSVLSQPKRLALLSYLAATASGQYQSRDRILALFWPESDEKRARSSLSESLSRLRNSLGPEAILTRGNEVAIDPQFVRSDLARFEAAAAKGDCCTVTELYRGPFLDGFVLDNGPDFDQWLESTRARIARTALDFIGRHADELLAREAPGAVACAERAVALSPLDGDAVARLMRFTAANGHRAEALQVYDRFERQLEAEMGMPPAERVRELAAAIRSGGVGISGNRRGGEAAGRGIEEAPGMPEGSGGVGGRGVPGEEGQTGSSSSREVFDAVAAWQERRRRSLGQPVSIVGAALVIALVAWSAWGGKEKRGAGDLGTVEFTFPVAEADGWYLGGRYDTYEGRPSQSSLAVSPDGSTIAFVARDSGDSRLFLRHLDRPGATVVAETEGAAAPFTSTVPALRWSRKRKERPPPSSRRTARSWRSSWDGGCGASRSGTCR